MYQPIQETPQTKSGIGQRVYQRVPFLRPITVVPMPGTRTVEARSLDISIGGVGLTCPVSLTRGQEVELAFPLDDPQLGKCIERIRGRVVNFVADLDGNLVGVEFLEPLQASRNPALTRAVARL
jgi:hypothetical protein